MSSRRNSDFGNMQVFAKNLKNYLAEKNVTQKELANKMKVSTGLVCDWANARAYPRMDKLQRLADFFGVEKTDLVESHNIDNEFYVSGQVTQIAKEISQDPELILIHQSLKKLSQSDRAIVKALLESLSKGGE